MFLNGRRACVRVHINVLCRQKQLHETDSRTQPGSTNQSPIIKRLPQSSAQTPACFPACFGSGDMSVFLRNTQRSERLKREEQGEVYFGKMLEEGK